MFFYSDWSAGPAPTSIQSCVRQQLPQVFVFLGVLLIAARLSSSQLGLLRLGARLRIFFEGAERHFVPLDNTHAMARFVLSVLLCHLFHLAYIS